MRPSHLHDHVMDSHATHMDSQITHVESHTYWMGVQRNMMDAHTLSRGRPRQGVLDAHTHLGMHVQCHAFGPPRHLATTHGLDGQKSDGHARDVGTHKVGSFARGLPYVRAWPDLGDMWQTSRVYVGPAIGHIRCYGRARVGLAATCTDVALWMRGRDARMATYTLCAGVCGMCSQACSVGVQRDNVGWRAHGMESHALRMGPRAPT